MIPDDIQPGETITADFLNRIKNRSDTPQYQDKPTQLFKYKITSVGKGKMMYWTGSTYDVDPNAEEEDLFGADDLEVDEEVHVLFSRGSGRLEVISGSSSGGGGDGPNTPCGPCGPRLNASLVELPGGEKAAQAYRTDGFNTIFDITGVVFEHLSGGEYVADDIYFECPEDPPDPEE